jgi:hypothetical protein
MTISRNCELATNRLFPRVIVFWEALSCHVALRLSRFLTRVLFFYPVSFDLAHIISLSTAVDSLIVRSRE